MVRHRYMKIPNTRGAMQYSRTTSKPPKGFKKSRTVTIEHKKLHYFQKKK